MARRKHSKIDLREPTVKDEVESMILSNNFTYKEIVEYIQDTTGTSISQQAVFRYAKGLSESLASIRMAQETFKAVQQELNRNPDLDTTEGIIQLLSHLLLNYVQNLSGEDLQDADPMKVMKQASELIRVASYKRNLDLKNKELSEMGFDAVKDKVFALMAKDEPALYKQLAEYINKKSSELGGDDV